MGKRSIRGKTFRGNERGGNHCQERRKQNQLDQANATIKETEQKHASELSKIQTELQQKADANLQQQQATHAKELKKIQIELDQASQAIQACKFADAQRDLGIVHLDEKFTLAQNALTDVKNKLEQHIKNQSGASQVADLGVQLVFGEKRRSHFAEEITHILDSALGTIKDDRDKHSLVRSKSSEAGF